MESIEELKRSVQFPKLESLPSDFLTQMEGYVREAPRKVDSTTAEVVAKRVRIFHKFLSDSTESAICMKEMAISLTEASHTSCPLLDPLDSHAKTNY